MSEEEGVRREVAGQYDEEAAGRVAWHRRLGQRHTE
jgi:hypothetical protein